MSDRLISHKALDLILDAHAGQKDKAGYLYRDHLWGVAKTVPEHLFLAALAHDLLEDTPTTEDDMLDAGFTHEEVELVKLLTLKKGQRRDDYLRKIRQNRDATAIKIADVLNNVSRLHQIEDEDERLRLLLKYQRTLEILVNGY